MAVLPADAGIDGGGYGAAVFVHSGSVELIFSTLYQGTVSGSEAAGGAIYAFGGTSILDNLIMAGSFGGDDCVDPSATAEYTSGQVSLVETNDGCGVGLEVPLIGFFAMPALVADGGLRAHIPLPGSAAADAAGGCMNDSGADVLTDQFGYPRPQGAMCDIGAIEEASCGDSVLGRGEGCDDGNGDTGDGCDACAVEAGWVCPEGAACACDAFHYGDQCENEQIVVTTVADVVADDGLCSLREAVSAVNDGLPSGASDGECGVVATGRVYLPAGTYELTLQGDEDANAAGDLDVSADLTLVGEGADVAVIDGMGTSRVLQVFEASVELSQVTLKGGYSDFSGGCLLCDTATCVLMDAAVEGCTADFSGAGVYVLAGTLEATRVRFVDNTAGAVAGDASGPDGPHVSLTDCLVADNVGEEMFSAAGVGINSSGSSGTASIVRTTFIGQSGGAVLKSRGSVTVVTNSTFTGNSNTGGELLATGNLGGTGPSITLDHCTVTGNTAETGVASGSALDEPMRFKSTIFAGNSFDTACDVGSPVESLGFNLIHAGCPTVATDVASDGSETYAPLDDSGVMAPGPGNPAIGADDCLDLSGAALAEDQRGVARAASACTIGAYEVICGDGFVDGDETCDDTNGDTGDGCDACQEEEGFYCLGEPSICQLGFCGDGFVAGGEACDDNFIDPGDGCSGTCTIEPGWACPPDGGFCFCAPGFFGPGCVLECPGGADNVCNGRGTCDDGLGGGGECTCNGESVGHDCTGAVITVTTPDDVVADDGLCSLREAISAANNDLASGAMAGECQAGGGGDEIVLGAATYVITLAGANENANATGDFDILSSIDIYGVEGETVVSAGQLDRVFDIWTAEEVILDGLVIADGKIDADGGCVHSARGADLTISSATIRDCTATDSSGGGYAGQGSAELTFDRVTFMDNTAHDTGGLYVADSQPATVVLSGCHFERNATPAPAFGAALQVNTSAGGGSATITGSSFIDNTGTYPGIFSRGYITVVRNSTFAANTGLGSDSAVVASGNLGGGAEVTLDHCTITGNTTENGVASFGLNEPILLAATVVSGNTVAAECELGVPVTSLGRNVVGFGCPSDGTGDVIAADPLLADPLDNGGGAITAAPEAASPVLDISDCLDTTGAPLATDQRGSQRPASGCTAGAYEVICGDGDLAGNEPCDDGDVEAGDGCGVTCAVEDGWQCGVTEPTPCFHTTCGDSFVEGLETCDDGNAEAGDGCDSLCRLEANWQCPVVGQACSCDPDHFGATCGNAIIVVATTADVLADDGVCSLREAFQSANSDTAVGGCVAGTGADRIEVPAGTFDLTLAGVDENAAMTGDLDVTSEVVVVGVEGETIIDGMAADRVIDVRSGAAATLVGVVLRNGALTGPTSNGGCLRADNDAALVVRDSSIFGCTAGQGGAIGTRRGSLTLERVLIAGNSAGEGAGVRVQDSAPSTVTVTDCVFANNTATNTTGTGALSVSSLGDAGTATVTTSTFFSNTGRPAALSTRGYATLVRQSTMAQNVGVGIPAVVIGVGDRPAEGSLVLDHTTVGGNTANPTIGSVGSGTEPLTLKGSLIAGNGGAAECQAGLNVSSLGGNLLGLGGCPADGPGDVVQAEAGVYAVDTNGGELQTAAPSLGTLAAGVSDCLDTAGGALTVDQRGMPRPAAGCTAGAYEVICNDGDVGGIEQCDDGANVAGDGCDAACGRELGYVCDGEPSTCAVCTQETCTEDCDSGFDEDVDGREDCEDTDCAFAAHCVDADPDEDQVSNALELACGTSPTDGSSTPSADDILNPDDDELLNCVDPNDDNDPLTDIQEAIACPGEPNAKNDAGINPQAAKRCEVQGVDADCNGAIDVSEVECGGTEGVCDDTLDDDHDAQTDCADVDCVAAVACAGTDWDQDGVPSGVEIICGFDPGDADSTPVPDDIGNPDGDEQINCVDDDDDNDGVVDVDEIACDSDPLNASDIPTADALANTDGDEWLNCEDTDDDNDGISDLDEVLCLSDPLDPNETPNPDELGDTDMDFLRDCRDPDDDNDTFSDEIELACGFDPLDANDKPTATQAADLDEDGLPNCSDPDDDGDNLSDVNEALHGTNPFVKDSDGDGLEDGAEDANDDGVVGPMETDPMKKDTDEDGLEDGEEAQLGTFGWNPDSDNDGLLDGAENEPNPLDDDSDDDEWLDGVEVQCGTSPSDAEDVPVDLDDNGICDGLEEDSDGDGVVDGVETLCMTDPGDISDFPSAEDLMDQDDDDQISCVDTDDDGDEASDEDEAVCGTDPYDGEDTPSANDLLDDDNDGELNCIDPVVVDEGDVVEQDPDASDSGGAEVIDDIAGDAEPADVGGDSGPLPDGAGDVGSDTGTPSDTDQPDIARPDGDGPDTGVPPGDTTAPGDGGPGADGVGTDGVAPPDTGPGTVVEFFTPPSGDSSSGGCEAAGSSLPKLAFTASILFLVLFAMRRRRWGSAQPTRWRR